MSATTGGGAAGAGGAGRGRAAAGDADPGRDRIAAAFAAGRAAGRPLVVPFVTAGYPGAGDTVPVVEALAQAGADMVEVGVPFSDPLADGPTIQRASEQALRNGMTLARVLEIVGELRSRPSTAGLPLVLMGYCNPLFAYGLDRFLRAAAAAGVDGLIVPDLPPEEAEEYLEGCRAAGLSATFLMAPNAPDERVRRVDACSTHFSYCVTVTGVTGARQDVESRTLEFLRRVRGLARKPFVVGFGVKEPAHVRSLGPHADGVVVGSALLDALADAADPAAAAGRVLGRLREAADELARGRSGSSQQQPKES